MRITENQLRRIIREEMNESLRASANIDERAMGIANSFMRAAISTLGEPDAKEASDLRSARDEMARKIASLVNEARGDVDSRRGEEVKQATSMASADAVRELRKEIEISVSNNLVIELDTIVDEANETWREIHRKTRRRPDTERWDNVVDGAYRCAKAVAHQVAKVKSKFTHEPYDYEPIDTMYDSMLHDFRDEKIR